MGYAVTHETPAGADLGLINLTGSASVRCYLEEIVIGSDATPADAQIQANLNRSTTVGTGGSALTEEKRDPLNPNAASGSAIGGTFTSEPTDGNELLIIPFNQRANFNFKTYPGRELISAATANNGLFLRSVSVSTGTPNLCSTLHWRE